MRDNKSGCLIETGRILGTHGIRGELRMQPWADSPDSLCNISCLYIDGKPVKVNSAKVHKSNLIISLDGIDNIDVAITLKNKVVSICRDDIKLEEGTYFIADLLGLSVIDIETGQLLGIIKDILTLPAHNVYVIEPASPDDAGRVKEMLVPAVSEFIRETNLEEGYIKIRVIDGLQ